MAYTLGMLTSGSFLTQMKTVLTSGKDTANYIVPICSVVLTIGLEYLLEDRMFVCPNKSSYFYSMLFLIGPCIPLFFASLMFTKEFNRTLSGFCGFWRRHGFRKNRYRSQCRYFNQHLLSAVMKCMLAPATWIVLVLLRKKIYTCLEVGTLESFKGDKASYDLAVLVASTESQIYGWGILISGVSVLCLLYFLMQCFTTKRKEIDCVEISTVDTYSAYEADRARVYFEAVCKKVALANGHAKVNALLGIASDNLQNNDEVENSIDVSKEKENIIKGEKEKLISFETIVEARNQMLQIYPRLCNPMDNSLPWYDHSWWKELEASSGEGGDKLKFETIAHRPYSVPPSTQ